MSNLLPWERRSDESAEAWEAFTIYLTMGSGRSGAKVAQALGKSVALIARWSVEHAWVARAAALDAETSREAIEAAKARQKEALAQQADVARALVATAAKLVTPPISVGGKVLSEDERRAWKPSPDAARAAAQALREGHTVTRLTMGLPTQITRAQSEAEEMVRKAIEAQSMMARIIGEGLCDDPTCACCTRVRGRLLQVQQYHEAIRQQFVAPQPADSPPR